MTPFIVAEIGAAHNGSRDYARLLVERAAHAGADAVKFQTWDRMSVCADTIKSGPWAGTSVRELYERAQTPNYWLPDLFAQARALGIVPFSTPFDLKSVDVLEKLNCAMYKIASFEITDLRLIRHVAATGKDIVISTGMATTPEIYAAVEAARDAASITLLYCVSAYPAKPEQFCLPAIRDMAHRFKCHVGISDHTRGSAIPVAATALGATLIEKHIGLDRASLDGEFVTLPAEFEAIVREVRAIGKAMELKEPIRSYGPKPGEEHSLYFRRSVWVVKDLAAGEIITPDHVDVLRPMGGARPEHYGALMGRTVNRSLRRGEPLNLFDLEPANIS